jgi:DNA transformation protein
MEEDNLLSFVVDQLSGLDGIATRRMFGGWHISLGGVFFIIVFKERLYFKTSEKSRARYEAAGMGPFRPRPKVTLKTLFGVPVEIIEDSEALTGWAHEAIARQEAAGLEKEKPRARKRKKKRRDTHHH